MPAPNPIAIIHGWSDDFGSFQKLREFLTARLGVPATLIRLGDWISLDDNVGYADIAVALERAWRAEHLPTAPRSVDVVVHSTGALVVREWMTRYHAPDTVPIGRFLQLAPANFGSHLAHKGRSFIGRAVKGWKTGFQTGSRILRGLELASPYTRALADRDLFVAPSKRWYGAGRILATVLVGNKGYSGIQAIANEPGSDGTVRIGTASLQVAQASVVFPPGPVAPMVQFRNAVGATAFAIVDGDNHSDITMKDRPSRNGLREDLILGALRVQDADFPETADGAFPWQATLDAKAGAAKLSSPRRQNTVVHLTDSVGDEVNDFFFEFWRSERSDKTFEQRFYQDVIGHVHVFGGQGAWRTLNLDIDKFEALRLHGTLGFQKLLVSVFASPAKTGNAKVGYSTATGRDIGAWHVEGRDFAKAFSPHRTLFVDIQIPRIVDDAVFRFRR
jgi:pimeloyl-ACP methyl ester carboxylesterase